jgi:hypothetical protein
VENKQADNKNFNMFSGSARLHGLPFIGSVFEGFGLDLRWREEEGKEKV